MKEEGYIIAIVVLIMLLIFSNFTCATVIQVRNAQIRQLRAEAVKLGHGRFVPDETGEPEFKWIENANR